MAVNMAQQRDARRRQHAKEGFPVFEADVSLRLGRLSGFRARGRRQNSRGVVRKRTANMNVQRVHGDLPVTCWIDAANSASSLSRDTNRYADSTPRIWRWSPLPRSLSNPTMRSPSRPQYRPYL